MGKSSFGAFLAPPEIFFFKKNTHFTLKIPVLWGVLGMIPKCRPQKGRRKSHHRPEFGSEWMRGHPNRQKTILAGEVVLLQYCYSCYRCGSTEKTRILDFRVVLGTSVDLGTLFLGLLCV